MKCGKCDTDYTGYDACPVCAKIPAPPSAAAKFNAGCNAIILTFVFLALFSCALGSCGH